MNFRHQSDSDEFNEIAKSLGLKWWFVGLGMISLMVSLMIGLT